MSWKPHGKVVVPIDFSEASKDAIQTALDMVDDPSVVHLVHVLTPLDNVSPGALWGNMTDEKREKAAHKYFDEFLKKCGISGVSAHVEIGDPGLSVAEYADKAGAALIVIPSHGYHGVKRLLLGSVAERVLRHAHCSVLVLRRPDAE